MRRVVRAVLFILPAPFRRKFGDEMLATFDDRWREDPGLRLGLRTLLDLIVTCALIRFTRRATSVPVTRKEDNPMITFWQDLQFSARTLLRSPSFTTVALITLALGIGVNTAMFSVARTVLWRSLPYPDADRVVQVVEADSLDAKNYWGVSYPNLRDWRSRSTSFGHLAGVMNIQHVLREGAEPVRVSGKAVSADFFDVMNVSPVAGRVFHAPEDRKGAPNVIVLSRRMWLERFGGDPAILGRSIRLDKIAFTVIGVMPSGFEYPREAEYWVPLEQELDANFLSHRDIWVLSAVGRLRPGVTRTQAQKDVESIMVQIRREYPETRRGLVVRATPLRLELSRDLRPALLVLLGAVGFVLLIVCGNVAGLMLVRGTARAREMAIRSALGVGSGGLLRLLLTESALLAGVGGLAGIGLAFLATRSITLLTQDPRLLNVPIDGPVLAFAAAVTVATTILFGTVPAIRAVRVDAAEGLRSGPRTGISRERALAQRVLVVAEVALSLVLLAGAGLLLKSLNRVFDVNPGFRADHLMTMRINLPLSYNSDATAVRLCRQLTERLSTLPGVSGVTIVSQLPVTGGEGNGDITVEGRSSAIGELGASTFRRAMPNYFSLMGIPLLRGRAFSDEDDGSKGQVAIINDSFARRFWPNVDPVGRRFKVGPRDRASWMTIVGVVGDVRQIGLDSAPPFSTYEPFAAGPQNRFDLALRAAGDSNSIVASVRRELRSLEPALLIDNVQTMTERIDESVSSRRLNLFLFELFAGLALLLAGIGLYGVVAYTAGQRTHEFGIRMALGAQARDVLRLVVRQGLSLALTGIAIGLVAALYLTRFMASLLFGVKPADPSTLVAVAAILLAVAAGACWLPAYRATLVAPVEALRSE